MLSVKGVLSAAWGFFWGLEKEEEEEEEEEGFVVVCIFPLMGVRRYQFLCVSLLPFLFFSFPLVLLAFSIFFFRFFSFFNFIGVLGSDSELGF